MGEATPGTCSVCGASMTGQVGGGQCPACLLALALEVDEEPGGSASRTYRLLSVLGTAVGRTRYLARGDDLQALVSLEIVDRAAVTGLEPRDLSGRLSQLLALRHAAIARVTDAWLDAAGDACVVSEYVPGRSLACCADLADGEVLRLFDGICAALEDAHGQGVVHGCLEPDSIVVVSSGAGVLPRLTGFSVCAVDASVRDDIAGLGRLLRLVTTGRAVALEADRIARRAEGAGAPPFDSVASLRAAAASLRKETSNPEVRLRRH